MRDTLNIFEEINLSIDRAYEVLDDYPSVEDLIDARYEEWPRRTRYGVEYFDNEKELTQFWECAKQIVDRREKFLQRQQAERQASDRDVAPGASVENSIKESSINEAH